MSAVRSFLAYLLVATVTQAAAPVKISTSFSPKTITALGEELFVRSSARVNCDALACPAGTSQTGSVSYSYGNKGKRGGNVAVAFNNEGGIDVKTTAVNPTSSNVVTHLKIGTCTYLNIAQQSVRFDQCGFLQVKKNGLIYREIVVQVRHHFGVPGAPAVSIFGGKDVTVRLYQEVLAPPAVLVPPTQLPEQDTIASCSALTHTLTVLVDAEPNRWSFMVTPNYTPSDVGVGFRLQSCTIRPYGVGVNQPSQDPAHAFKLIEDGAYTAVGSGLYFDQTVVTGYSYTLTAESTSPAPTVPASFDSKRESVVDCEVCLCSITGTTRPGLRACPSAVRTSTQSRRVNPYAGWRKLGGGTLQAGRARVVPEVLPMF